MCNRFAEARVITADIPPSARSPSATTVASDHALVREPFLALLHALSVEVDLRASDTDLSRVEPVEPDVSSVTVRRMCVARPAARPDIVAWRSQALCPSYRLSNSADPPELRDRTAHHRFGRGDKPERSRPP